MERTPGLGFLTNPAGGVLVSPDAGTGGGRKMRSHLGFGLGGRRSLLPVMVEGEGGVGRMYELSLGAGHLEPPSFSISAADYSRVLHV